ncbi:MAG: tRNA (guanosine(37)-N1)-methyltransferase TrmD [Bacteroidota bacterium]
MHIDIITCLPDLLTSPFSHSIVKRAIEKKLVTICIHNLRDYGIGKHKQIDDKPYGGQAGMVLMIEPIVNCINSLQKNRTYDEVIYMSPDGEKYNQPLANTLSLKKKLLILCGHYKGIDERVRTHFITREISIGDYVISGGELAATVVVDSLVRLLPGVLNDSTSALTDSFQNNLIAPPVYTRPANFKNLKVPEVLLSGHAKHIEEWAMAKAIERTKKKRNYLLKN